MAAAQFATANRIADALRAQGRTVLVDYSERRFRNVLQQADEVGASRLYIIGEAEIAKGVAKILDLEGGRTERIVPLTDFTSPSSNPSDT
jgi:histidyl-tRNA synthetase